MNAGPVGARDRTNAPRYSGNAVICVYTRA